MEKWNHHNTNYLQILETNQTIALPVQGVIFQTTTYNFTIFFKSHFLVMLLLASSCRYKEDFPNIIHSPHMLTHKSYSIFYGCWDVRDVK